MTEFRWVEQGHGTVRCDENRWTLTLPSNDNATYTNAMLTSYNSRTDFDIDAPTCLELTAHMEGLIQGTAGFGFWNHPYGAGIHLPRAVWFFFSSSHSNMPLAIDVPGSGFKAAVFDAQRGLFYALLPFAPAGVMLMRIPKIYKMLWPIGQRAIGVDECALDTSLLAAPRRYKIDWGKERVEFMIDGAVVFTTRRVPQGKLGFVAWIDNQYAVVTPQGKFKFGVVGTQGFQRLIVEDISITTGCV